MSRNQNVTTHVGIPPEDYERIPAALARQFNGAPLKRSVFIRWAVRRALDEILGPPPKNAKAGKKGAVAQVAERVKS